MVLDAAVGLRVLTEETLEAVLTQLNMGALRLDL
jgi:hypothetical protein